MKSVPKLIRRFVGILFMSLFILIVLNITVLLLIGMRYQSQPSPYKETQAVAEALDRQDGQYVLGKAAAQRLEQIGAWAVLLNVQGQVVWKSDNLPQEIPLSYSLADISALSTGYLKDYPTYTAEYGDGGLVVAGFAKDSYFKYPYQSMNLSLVRALPQIGMIFLAVNVVVVFLIYIFSNLQVTKSIRPLVQGIHALAQEKAVHLKERGLLSELAQQVNRASDIIQSKNRELAKKETARANWIAGVSHDIRTPLSMVLGYANELENNAALPEPARRQAAVICTQSLKMKQLIGDLNLASKLEYNMQPLHLQKLSAVAAARSVVAECINSEAEGIYTYETDFPPEPCWILADSGLVARAVSNLVQNSRSHNPQGCVIRVSVFAQDGGVTIRVQDSGAGVSAQTLQDLQNRPHYMFCDAHIDGQRHGLGLLIVRQIMLVHGGQVRFASEPGRYFQTDLQFASYSEQKASSTADKK